MHHEVTQSHRNIAAVECLIIRNVRQQGVLEAFRIPLLHPWLLFFLVVTRMLTFCFSKQESIDSKFRLIKSMLLIEMVLRVRVRRVVGRDEILTPSSPSLQSRYRE